jgi:hypothetical protein
MRVTPISTLSSLRRLRPLSAMHKYLSCAISRLPVLEENTIPSVGAFTRIAPATLVVLVQLIDRLGQGFRGN